jgi:serine protease Do
MDRYVLFVCFWRYTTKFLIMGSSLIAAWDLRADDGVSAQAGLASAKSLSAAFRSAAEKALPAVVTILGRVENKEQPVLNVIGGPDEQVYSSVGSGVIISNDGLILTNHHVVADMQLIDVRTFDGRQFRAEDIKSDPESDLAILRVNSSTELPLAELGDSDQLHVGDWVLAIGSPFTLESSVSAGIISRAQRHRRLSAKVIGIFLQTDAAINPGNSGGPLLDLDGKVIGINTAISSQSGGFQGVGFAIPVTRAKWIRKELEEFGKVRRAFAGISVLPIPPEVAEKQNLAQLSGAYVASLKANKPGQKAGLQTNDIILSLGGQVVNSSSSFLEIVQRSPIDQPLKMLIIRDDKKMELEITLEARD